ncbi:MAG: hypothetical protein N2314_02525 [Brevinematales bacterium]|nr:hypothetical protein [Brevinematales bacterium]
MEKTCKKVMDYIDDFPHTSYPEWVKAHLETCRHCFHYATLSEKLQKLHLRNHTMPEGEVPSPLPSPPSLWYWLGGIAAAMIVTLILWGGLSLFQPISDIPRFSSSFTNTIPEREVQVIDTFTEIALLW